MDRDEILRRHSALRRFIPQTDEYPEVRSTRGIEVRADGEGDEMRLVGHAAVFNEWTTIGSWFQERIDPGAFDQTLKDGADVRLLFNHNPDTILARTANETLALDTDKKGLTYDGLLNADDPQAVSIHAKIARGDVDQSSFAFRVIREEWEDSDGDGKELPKRTILEAQLFDVSPVTYPAYEGTDVGVRGAALGLLSSMLGLTERKREMLLRAMEDEVELPEGFERAIDLISPIFTALLQSREVEGEEEEPSGDPVVPSVTEPLDPEGAPDSESDDEPEGEGGPEGDPSGEPAAEPAPDLQEAEEEAERSFADWFQRFTQIEGRVPTSAEIAEQFPSSSTQETPTL